MDSNAFDFKYEMNILPSDEDLDGNSVADFTFTAVGSGAASVSGGVLTMSSPDPDGSPSPSTYFAAIDAATVWPGKYGGKSYTFEMSAKVQSGTNTEPYGATSLYIIAPNTYSLGWFNIHETGQTWNYAASQPMGGSDDNTDTFHQFRLAYDAGTDLFSVWRDGVLIREDSAPVTVWGGEDRMIFGDLGGYFNGTVEYDYVRFTEGAFAPVPEPGTMALLGLGALLFGVYRRRRAA